MNPSPKFPLLSSALRKIFRSAQRFSEKAASPLVSLPSQLMQAIRNSIDKVQMENFDGYVDARA
ncbi:hypothetical protein [Croceibacterium xixiisoli]|uniref:hypothetical protein n=1 Tax=Croceibacterium xixiisoli TaxID=1476466 RepID=UPI001369D978|nr:hypothetical protein [Croceibacterium xixiisoli]